MKFYSISSDNVDTAAAMVTSFLLSPAEHEVFFYFVSLDVNQMSISFLKKKSAKAKKILRLRKQSHLYFCATVIM